MSYSDMQQYVGYISIYLMSLILSLATWEAQVLLNNFIILHLKSTVNVDSQSSKLITVVYGIISRQNNTQAIITTLLNTEITGGGFLPVSLILLSLARAGITVSVLSCLVCDVVEGQSNLSPQMCRQQDIIENPVREITAHKESGCDWCTNYRKCSMHLSSCICSMFVHLDKVVYVVVAFPDSIIPKLRHLVIDKITCVIFYLSSADKSNVVHWWPHLFVFQNDSNTASNKVLSVSIQTWVLSAEKKDIIIVTIRSSQSPWGDGKFVIVCTDHVEKGKRALRLPKANVLKEPRIKVQIYENTTFRCWECLIACACTIVNLHWQ